MQHHLPFWEKRSVSAIAELFLEGFLVQAVKKQERQAGPPVILWYSEQGQLFTQNCLAFSHWAKPRN